MKKVLKFSLIGLFAFLFLFVGLAAVRTLLFDSDISASAKSDGEGDIESGLPASSQRSRHNFLVLGKDNVSGLCDMMMLVSYDEKNESVAVVQIPRDTYAEFSSGNYKKINGAVSALGSEEALCDFLSKSLAVPIDYYISLDLDAVGDIVDALGGVEVDVPFDMDYEDPAQKLSIHIKKGRNVLDGNAARQFVRYRAGYVRGDIGRIDAQKLFLAALIREVKSGVSVTEAANIALRVLGDIKTNVSIDRISALIGGALAVESENIRFVTLAGEEATATSSGASYYVMSRPSAMKIVNEFLGGSADEDAFDSGRVFLNEKYEEFRRIYDSPADYKVHDAKSILEEGLEIAGK